MTRTAIVFAALLPLLSSVTLAAQTPATQTALGQAADLAKTLKKAQQQLDAITATLVNAPPCPVTVCPLCPPPVICPTCPPPTICPPPSDCVVSAWSEWSAWISSSPTEETRTRTRVIISGACPATETETRLITGPVVPTVADTAALNAALLKPGDYQLVPGGIYVGNFVMATDGVRLHGAPNLPAARVAAGATAAYTLVPSDKSRPVLAVTASHVLVDGITLSQGQPDRAVVAVGSPDVADPLLQPDDVTFNRIEIVAGALGGIRGIGAHTRAFVLTNSRIVNFWWQGADSQALYICNGPGPYTITDNQLQASGENFLSGGGSIRSVAMIPANVVLSNNTIDKPLAWRTAHPGSVKNSIEFKSVKTATVEGNLVDGMWPDAQQGAAIVLTPRNQYNDSPWAVVQDVVIRKNRLINHLAGAAGTVPPYWINILGTDNIWPSQQTARITIEGNYSESPNGIQIVRGVAGWLKVTNNTLPKIIASVLAFEGNQVLTPLTFQRNVVRAGTYGLQGQVSGGVAGLDYYCAPGWVVSSNVIEQPVRTIWPYTGTNTQLKFIVAPDTLVPYLDAEGHYVAGGAGW